MVLILSQITADYKSFTSTFLLVTVVFCFRYYITYHQWNSKPEFIVATHKVINYKEVLNQNDNAKVNI